MLDSRKLEDLHPVFRPQARAFLAECEARGLSVLVTSTLRDLEMQKYLYSLGRTRKSHVGPWTEKKPLGSIVTNAKPGTSSHNYGLAMDVVPLVGGKPVWDVKSPLWKKVGEAAAAAKIDWYGAPDAPFKEYPHVQMPNWRSYIPKV